MVGVAVTDLEEQLPLCRCGVTDVRRVAAGPFFNLEYDLINNLMMSTIHLVIYIVCSWIAVSNHYGSVYDNAHVVLELL